MVCKLFIKRPLSLVLFSYIKQIWNTFSTWLNDILKCNIEPISIAVKKIFDGATINLGKIPTYSIRGFPEDGWFRASKSECLGQFDDVTSYIANNKQIEYGIAAGVEEAYRGMMRAIQDYGRLISNEMFL